MRRASTLAALLLCASLGFAPAPVYKEPAGKKDLLSRMLGKWQDGDPRDRSIVVIGRGTLTTSYPGWEFTYAVRVEDGRDPPDIDISKRQSASTKPAKALRPARAAASGGFS